MLPEPKPQPGVAEFGVGWHSSAGPRARVTSRDLSEVPADECGMSQPLELPLFDDLPVKVFPLTQHLQDGAKVGLQLFPWKII